MRFLPGVKGAAVVKERLWVLPFRLTPPPGPGPGVWDIWDIWHRTYADTAVVVAGCLARRMIGRCPDVVEKLLHPELGIFFLVFSLAYFGRVL